MTKPCVAPGVGTIEHDDLITLVQHNIPGMGRGLSVAGREALAQRPHLFKAGIIAELQGNRAALHHLNESIHGAVVLQSGSKILPVYIDVHLHFLFLHLIDEIVQTVNPPFIPMELFQ